MIESENFPLYIPHSPSVLIPHIKLSVETQQFSDFQGAEITQNLFERYSELLALDPHYLTALEQVQYNFVPNIDTFSNPGDAENTVKFQEGRYIYSIFTSSYEDIDLMRYCVGRTNERITDFKRFDPEKHLEEVIRIVMKRSDIEDISFIMTEGFSKEGQDITHYHNPAAQVLIENVFNFREVVLAMQDERKN